MVVSAFSRFHASHFVFLLFLSVLVLFVFPGGFDSLFRSFSSSSSDSILGDSSSPCVGVSRDSYPLDPAVFDLLPPLPPCLVSVSHSVESGSFSQLDWISEEYYLQPEFYPPFEEEGLRAWSDPSRTHYGAVGYGLYPFESILVLSPGESATVRLFLHSGFGVRSFQEGVLVARPDLPKYLSVSLDDVSSSSIVLSPSFPQFYPGWVHPVDVTITRSSSSPLTPMTVSLYSSSVLPSAQRFFPVEGEYYYSFTDFLGERLVGQITIISP